MTRQEEQYIYFFNCIQNLNNALRILQKIKQQPGNILIRPAFEFALIEYSKPYTISRGNFDPAYKLGDEFVPLEYLDLHKDILSSRNKIHAHSDLTKLDASLHVHEVDSKNFCYIIKNVIDNAEELSRIDEIISLIENSLDLMYVEEEHLKSELHPL